MDGVVDDEEEESKGKSLFNFSIKLTVALSKGVSAFGGTGEGSDTVDEGTDEGVVVVVVP